MQVQLLKSKIHRAAVTDANVNYEGSLTVDRSLMEKVGLPVSYTHLTLPTILLV